MLLICSLGLFTPFAWAAPPQNTPTVTIQAEVAPTGWIAGTLYADDPDLVFINPLDSIEIPNTDRDFRRTYPGVYDPGSLEFGPTGDGGWWFITRLPRRFGDFGQTRHGLFANGGWYPQPLRAGEPIAAHWNVDLSTQSDGVLVLGPLTGETRLIYHGYGYLVSLALMSKASRITLQDNDTTLHLVHNRPRVATVNYLKRNWEHLHTAMPYASTTAVIAPLRRRLARPGEGVTYVSDRAFRLSPLFKPVHRRAVVQALIEGALTFESAQQESLVAALLANAFEHSQRLSVANGILKYGSWNPVVYSLLYSGTMPFYSETMGKVHPSDPVQDALLERLSPLTPGSVVAAQLTARYGDEIPVSWALERLRSDTLQESLQQSPIGLGDLENWAVAYPKQDYALSPNRSAGDGLTVTRSTDHHAPRETLTIRTEKGDQVWTTKAGPDTLNLDSDIKRVTIDPDQITRQESTLNDRWPSRWTFTTAASLTTLNLGRTYAEGYVTGWFRKANTNRNIPSLTVSTTRENWVAARLGFLHQFGPKLTGTLRTQRVSLSARTAILNPKFADMNGNSATAEVGAGWRWDTRNEFIFPTRGASLAASTGLGTLPGSDQWWWSMFAGGTKLMSPHPRHVIAGQANLAYADSPLPHRILDMGGPNALRSLPPTLFLVNGRATARLEYRASLLRDLSVPMLILWGSELQLSSGFECGLGVTPNDQSWACGATAGITGVGDLFGGIPQMMGLTAGWPLVTTNLDIEPSLAPELYLRWWQEF